MTQTRQPEIPTAAPGTPLLDEDPPHVGAPPNTVRFDLDDEPAIGSENYIG